MVSHTVDVSWGSSNVLPRSLAGWEPRPGRGWQPHPFIHSMGFLSSSCFRQLLLGRTGQRAWAGAGSTALRLRQGLGAPCRGCCHDRGRGPVEVSG